MPGLVSIGTRRTNDARYRHYCIPLHRGLTSLSPRSTAQSLLVGPARQRQLRSDWVLFAFWRTARAAARFMAPSGGALALAALDVSGFRRQPTANISNQSPVVVVAASPPACSSSAHGTGFASRFHPLADTRGCRSPATEINASPGSSPLCPTSSKMLKRHLRKFVTAAPCI